MPVAIIGPKFYAWDNDTGKPLAFGKVFTYQSGTNTPKATFTTEGGETQNANPTILNGAGYADIFLNGSYKIVVKDADDVEVWTSDPVSDPSQLQQEWVRQRNITQVDTTTFTVNGELTDEYVEGVAVRVKQNSGFVIGTVASATYVDGKTTVTLDFPGTETITTSAVYAERALVSFQSLPKNLGDRTIYVGSVAEPTLQITVPTDYSTLQEAWEYAATAFSASTGKNIEILIESGFEPTSGIAASNGCFSFVTISSTDPEVTVGAGFTGDFISITNGDGPVLNCLVNQNGLGGTGYRIQNRSSGQVSSGCGVKNAGGKGLYVTKASEVAADGSIWDGAAEQGVLNEKGSVASLLSASFQNTGNQGCFTNTAVTYAQGANASGSGTKGFDGFGVHAGVLNAENAIANGCGLNGFEINRGAIGNLPYVEAKNNAASGIFAFRGSSVVCIGAVATGNAARGIYAYQGATVAAMEADCTSNGDGGVRAQSMSTVNITGVNGRINGPAGADSPDDFIVLDGGILAGIGSGTTGGNSQSPQRLDRQGIIFRGTSSNLLFGDPVYDEGSTSNGHWRRYDSGFMECWLRPSDAATASASGSRSSGVYLSASTGEQYAWYFPKDFIEAPTVTCDSLGIFTSATHRNATVGSCEIFMVGYDGAVVDETVVAHAIGRWK